MCAITELRIEVPEDAGMERAATTEPLSRTDRGGGLLAVLGIAVGTYVALYAITTWLGSFA